MHRLITRKEVLMKLSRFTIGMLLTLCFLSYSRAYCAQERAANAHVHVSVLQCQSGKSTYAVSVEDWNHLPQRTPLARSRWNGDRVANVAFSIEPGHHELHFFDGSCQTTVRLHVFAGQQLDIVVALGRLPSEPLDAWQNSLVVKFRGFLVRSVILASVSDPTFVAYHSFAIGSAYDFEYVKYGEYLIEVRLLDGRGFASKVEFPRVRQTDRIVEFSLDDIISHRKCPKVFGFRYCDGVK